jgi:ATP-binding cassette subfamily A (ABC1) protein 1
MVLGDFEQPVTEAEPEGFRAGVQVTNLGKTYSNGKIALKDLTINFYENQITS